MSDPFKSGLEDSCHRDISSMPLSKLVSSLGLRILSSHLPEVTEALPDLGVYAL